MNTAYRFFNVFLIFVIVCISGCSSSSTLVNVDTKDLAQYVNPFIGTGGLVQLEPGVTAIYDSIRNKKPSYPFGGLVFPGAAIPFGMIQLSLDCNKNNSQLGWSAGYHYSDTSMLGFSHMHTSGNGMSFGHFLFLPVEISDSLNVNQYLSGEIRNTFNHADEEASPGYYAVKFTNCNIKAELTATTRVGIHRYIYNADENASVIVNLEHGLGDYLNLKNAGLNIINDTIISGYRLTDQGVKTYFVAHFSAPFIKADLYDGKNVSSLTKTTNGKSIKALLFFGKLKKPLIIRVGLSFCSVAGAENNIQVEANKGSFDYYRLQARAAWNRELTKIILKEGKKDDVVKFYTALYHSSLTPFEFSDADSSYLCADNIVRKSKGFKNYTFFSLWDTYRALNPLHTIINAARVNDMMQSMVIQGKYSKNNIMPMWCLASKNYSNMAGPSVAIVMAEAWEKGFKNFDARKGLQYLKTNLNTGIYPGYSDYVKDGFLPCDVYDASVPRTLEYAFSDWNVGKLCSLLGDKGSTEFYYRSGNYLNLACPDGGFIRPRYKNRTWKSPFDPRHVSHHQPGDDYMESNAWQNNWLVMQDVPGLIKSLGGNQKFTTLLNSVFEQPTYLTGSYAADVSGLIGQYAQGNQPDHHVAYLFTLAGEASKAQLRIKQIADSTYKNSPEGLPGNDDGGEMSAWLVFSSLGFYPVNPASGNYIIGTPLFSYAEIEVGFKSLKKFIIEAKNISEKNIYIQSVTLNGNKYNQNYISHTDLSKGGHLIFRMGDKPSDWGKN
ncbi:MAG TPA: GH92 family glycosyl hydrolase [Chitinophagaceae bacterium]|nr:GH92 family glycosyl hydrolase [Chitinophagaceae bacterium]